MGRIQRGHIYEASGAFLVRYWTTEIVNGQPKRVQRSHFLCRRDKGKHDAINAKAVKLLRDAFMLTINSQQSSGRSLQDMRVVDFVDQKYFPYCEEIVQLTGEPRNKASTVRGYKQIWRQHFQKHFGKTTLQEYEPYMGTRFLQSLTSTQGKTTLKHVKALGGSIFKSAVIERRIKLNPWHDVEMPEDAIEPKSTAHYTLAEADDMISALVDHVDCQLILALSCFLGLRPNEIAALRWQDFGDDFIHIRFGVVRGHVDTPKTAESVAEIPLINQAGKFIELWRQKCGNPTKS